MADKLTLAKIDAGLKVCEEATAGRWEYDAAEVRALEGHFPFGEIIVDANDGVLHEDDGNFIALARTLLPRALAELRERAVDTERLDWLAEYSVRIVGNGHPNGMPNDFENYGRISLRAAIDATRRDDNNAE